MLKPISIWRRPGGLSQMLTFCSSSGYHASTTGFRGNKVKYPIRVCLYKLLKILYN